MDKTKSEGCGHREEKRDQGDTGNLDSPNPSLTPEAENTVDKNCFPPKKTRIVTTVIGGVILAVIWITVGKTKGLLLGVVVAGFITYVITGAVATLLGEMPQKTVEHTKSENIDSEEPEP